MSKRTNESAVGPAFRAGDIVELTHEGRHALGDRKTYGIVVGKTRSADSVRVRFLGNVSAARYSARFWRLAPRIWQSENGRAAFAVLEEKR